MYKNDLVGVSRIIIISERNLHIMYTNGGNDAFSDIFHQGSHREVISPPEYLRPKLDTQDIIKESKRDIQKSLAEEGPTDQNDIRKTVNLGFQAQIQRAEVIDQLGGNTAEELGQIPTDPPRPRPARPNAIKAKTRAASSVSKKRSAANGRVRKTVEKKKKKNNTTSSSTTTTRNKRTTPRGRFV